MAFVPKCYEMSGRDTDCPTQNIPGVCLKLDCEMRSDYVFGIGDSYVGCRHCFSESVVEKGSAERWKSKTKTTL